MNEWFCFWVELCAYRLIRMKMYTAKAIRAVKTGCEIFHGRLVFTKQDRAN